MGWNEIISGGTGWSEYRIAIEAFDYGFVTNRAMTKTSGGVQYLNGLMREGLQINNSVDLDEFKIRASTMNFGIVDLGEQATQVFVRRPTYSSRLIAELSDFTTTVSPASMEGISSGSYLFIGTEAIKVVSTGSTTFTSERGVMNSDIQYHSIESEMEASIAPMISDVPLILENRRVYLYAYGNGDDLQGNGALIWRGVVQRNPTMAEPGKWKIAAYPILERLKGELRGTGFSEMKVRGIYHKDFQLRIAKSSTADVRGSEDSAITLHLEDAFHENRDAFVYELNQSASVLATTAGWTEIPSFAFLPDGTMAMFYTTEATPKALVADIRSDIFPKEEGFFAGGIGAMAFPQGDGTGVYTVEAGTGYYQTPLFQDGVTTTRELPYPSAMSQGRTIRVSAPDLPSSDAGFGIMAIDNRNDEKGTTIQDFTVNSTNRSITINDPDIPEYYGPSSFLTNGDLRWDELVITNEDFLFNLAFMPGTEKSIHGFLTSMTTYGQLYINQGIYPNISADDFDLPGIAAALSGASLSLYQLERDYIFYEAEKSIEDIVTEELKLINYIPSFTTDGRITIKRFKFASLTAEGSREIAHSEILTDKGWPAYDKSIRIRNVATLKAGYDPKEDEHKTTVSTFYLDSISLLNGKKRSYEIAPVSVSTVPLTNDIIDGILMRPLIVRGVPLVSIEIDVPLTCFQIGIGDPVSLSSLHIPNVQTGRLGIEQIPGMVYGTKWDLDSGRGKLQIVTSEIAYKGYSPSADIASATQTGPGKNIVITLADNSYSIAGESDGAYFRLNDRIEIVQNDAWEPIRDDNTRIDKIVSTDPYQFQVNIGDPDVRGAILSSSSGEYQIKAQGLFDAIQERQADFCFVLSGTASGAQFNSELEYFGP